MHLFKRALFASAACALLALTAASGVRAAADPPAAKPASVSQPIPDQDIYIKDIDLEFYLPGEYKQPASDKEFTPGDAFEAFGPKHGIDFRPHIELILFNDLPANAVISKDITEQIAKRMGEKVNDFKIVEQGKVRVAGQEVPTISSTFRFKADKSNKAIDASLLLRNKQVLFIHKAPNGKDTGYMFVFTADAAKYADQVEAFDHLIGSISYPSVTDAAKSAAPKK